MFRTGSRWWILVDPCSAIGWSPAVMQPLVIVGAAALLAVAQPTVLTRVPTPQAPESAWRIAEHTLSSKVLQETRRIAIAVPPSFDRTTPARRYPVIVVLGGESLLSPVISAAAELARHGQLPEAVVVGIHNTHRLRDLTPFGMSVSGSSRREGGDTFLDFIDQELLPAVDSQFRTNRARTLLGHSSGGILATYAAATRSTYRAVVALDTPAHLDGNVLLAKMPERTAKGESVLRYASVSAQYGWPADSWAQLTAAAPPAWTLSHQVVSRESHNSVQLLGAYLGLRDVFADYSRLSAPTVPTTSILPYYDSLSAVFGDTLEPPATLLRDIVEDFVLEGRGADACSTG